MDENIEEEINYGTYEFESNSDDFFEGNQNSINFDNLYSYLSHHSPSRSHSESHYAGDENNYDNGYNGYRHILNHIWKNRKIKSTERNDVPTTNSRLPVAVSQEKEELFDIRRVVVPNNEYNLHQPQHHNQSNNNYIHHHQHLQHYSNYHDKMRARARIAVPQSLSPTRDSFRSTVAATPTVDNRRRIHINAHPNHVTPSTPSSSSPHQKQPQDRKTKIQVCVRVRPILPSDAANHNSTSALARDKSIRGGGNLYHNSQGGSYLPSALSMDDRSVQSTRSTRSNTIRQTFSNRSLRPTTTKSSNKNLLPQQIAFDPHPAWTVTGNNISQSLHTNPDTNRTINYTFDHTFGPKDSTTKMYREIVQESVISTMEGYHASVFAYGQTATGKTYTMAGSGGVKNTSRIMNRRRRGMNGTGTTYDDHEDDYTIDEDDHEDDPSKGIIQLSIEDVFDYIYNQKSETREYLLRVSFMEIYNEVINDLLATSPTTPASSTANHSSSRSMGNMNTPPPAPSAIRIFESKHEGVIIRGLKEEIVTCPEQVYALLAAGEKRRQTGSTLLNKQSSRSHSIFRLIVESRRRNVAHNSNSNTNMSDSSSLAESIASSTFAPESTAGPVRVSTLSLVDLAGSESVKNTGSKGTRQKEGQYINKSLLTLGHVVYKLAEVSSKGGANGGRAVDATHIPVS